MCIRDRYQRRVRGFSVSNMRGLVLLATIVLIGNASRIPPQYSTNRTVYHLNPASAGNLPINMDTGDALGDLYFYLGQFLLPLECANVSALSRAHFDCDNSERHGDLVVTQVEMEFDSRTTQYSGCNLCNGTDPLTGKPCKVGEYLCDCEVWGKGGPTCDPSKVGVSNITETFAPGIPTAECTNAMEAVCGPLQHNASACFPCLENHYGELLNGSCAVNQIMAFCPNSWEMCPEHDWGCWLDNIPRLTGGLWFSTQTEGYCDPQTEADCTWAVHGLSTINETCMRKTVIESVEQHDDKECFSACGARNTTSACWIKCFFNTLMGPDSDHSTSLPLTGMTVMEVEKAWTDAFLPEAQGGCPLLPS
eukprot:TRINITY_DN5410_c0_g1_i1.p1 TRINITY_DN5410_c0_g1~~TRINITY_DN5410_c0_g1_i1.p1  ORF type:complete len:364 (+),score=62.10 TRINITY_DN5410_c0_g1_i1:142-1233(+)